MTEARKVLTQLQEMCRHRVDRAEGPSNLDCKFVGSFNLSRLAATFVFVLTNNKSSFVALCHPDTVV